MSEKTEEPTPRRLRRAQQDGDNPVSSVVTQSLVFVTVLAVAPGALAALSLESARWLTRVLEGAPVEAEVVAWQVLILSAPLIAVGALTAFVVGITQTGGSFAFKRTLPDFTRLNPVSSLKNVVSLQRLFGLVRALFTASLLGWLTFNALRSELPSFAASVGSLDGAALLASSLARKLAWLAAGVGLALSAIDLFITRFMWRRRLRMSKDEVKREHKESEGDPEIKAARRRAHEEALRGSTVNAVRTATVVVVNPTHLAVALRYEDEEHDAPEVVASGRGELAQLMVEAARAYNVPVVQDIPLARALIELEVGEEIPEALYEAVAAVLKEVWQEEQPD